MLSFSYKKIGYLFISLALMALLSTLIPIFFNFTMDTKSSSLFGWFLLGGLIVVTFSKEKYETNEIETLRLKSFFKGFFASLGGIVAGSLSNLLIPGKVISMESTISYLEDNSILKLCTLTLILHLILFRKELKKL
ncbi:hypothetical protein [Dyadobacter sp. CY356]|uniref:hypothetical protein n=1 Tax=Dyadobacter sp. CY356 TaxID=2906442 RepID=UPI001F1E32D0|nr:hypothetical protein [Dyadobacter sp. CY356]MCF0054154.1 hypothetical protein [Dyadobacter sp. CY356]